MIDEDAADQTEDLCEKFEGFRSGPYLCPAGVPSIGFGATFYLDGRPVRLTDPPISVETARSLLRKTIVGVFQPGTAIQVPGATGAALAALTDFSFNLGLTRLKGSTLRRKFNAGNISGAIDEILKWNRGGGRVLPGLVLRRHAEALLLSSTTTTTPSSTM
jgi:lysozyme